LKYTISAKSLNVLNFKVTNDQGDPINFNGIHWYLCFAIEATYILSPESNLAFNQMVQQISSQQMILQQKQKEQAEKSMTTKKKKILSSDS
jgi:hypothetical protein